MITQQRTTKIEFKRLKGLNSLLEDNAIELQSDGVTAIMGPNGCGKSTVLHALACCYRPSGIGTTKDYKFSEFFLPNTDSRWTGSEFTLHYEQSSLGAFSQGFITFSKQSDRWAPKYDRRPQRPVVFIGIKTCVPRIEIETKNTFLHYDTTELTERSYQEVRRNAGVVLNRDYSQYNNITTRAGARFIGVECAGVKYSALSMGAGEQRLFTILTEVHTVPQYSLVLIDEIDLLLHTDALRRLISHISDVARARHLQIVFTTHREAVLDFDVSLSIKHLANVSGRTLCLSTTTPDAIQRLTGRPVRPLEIFVEDDLSKAIIKKVASGCGISRLVTISKYGAAKNCFTVVAALVLMQEQLNNSLFVLDGDVYTEEAEQQAQMNKILTGDAPGFDDLRDDAVSHIFQYNIPPEHSPESYIHESIRSIAPYDDESLELITTARSIVSVANRHDYINTMLASLDLEKTVGYAKIIDLFSRTDAWSSMTRDITAWISTKAKELAP